MSRWIRTDLLRLRNEFVHRSNAEWGSDKTESLTLDQYLKANGIRFFSGAEMRQMLRLGETAPEPPRRWWPRIIPTLILAEALRMELGHPLIVGNGYRPEPFNRRAGGATFSTHKAFRALDLDLPRSLRGQREAQERLYQAAGELYLSVGAEFKMGLGLYRMWGGDRVHIDTGRYQRAWERQYAKPLLRSLR